jgi:2-keto-4-pentenoate hydratase/2-oxohepta-3-ene-1,7-dioic acid hydratase in catechol pathway
LVLKRDYPEIFLYQGGKMKFLRFISQNHPKGSFAVIEQEKVRVLSGNPLYSVEKTSEIVPLKAIEEFLPPVNPPNIIALGSNYREHVNESKVQIPSHPLIFIKTTNTLTAHKQPIVLPKEAPDEVDYEVELAVVIKDKIKDIPEEEALKHVFGYTIGQDISARDCQLKYDQQWARGKSFDTFCPIGPWIETELDPENVVLRTILNKDIMQEESTSNMIFSVSYLVSYISRMMTLFPGTIIMTGTPSGVGFSRKPPVFLREGDILISEIEGIGRMENYLVKEK